MTLDRELQDIITEVKEFMMDPTKYSITCSSNEEMEFIDVKVPEWIKLQDDVLTERDFECDLITGCEEGIHLRYIRDREYDWYIGEREGDGVVVNQ